MSLGLEVYQEYAFDEAKLTNQQNNPAWLNSVPSAVDNWRTATSFQQNAGV